MSPQPLIFQAIGTQWHVQLDDDMPAEFTHDLSVRIRERINLFERDYSRFLPDSLLNVMSRKPGRYSLPNDARPLLDLYQKLYVATKGIFTPLIGQTLVAAGYDSSYSLQPSDLHSPAAWDEVLEYSYPFLTVKKAAQLDFGGLGKGCVVDLVVNLLREHHVHSFCINAGGDIYYQNQGNAHISVGLENPQDPLQALGVAHILNQSICGSSGSRRAWGDFHHIIDPHSLSSPKHILATWVVAQTTLLADAMATCLFLVPSSILLKEFEFEYLIVFPDYSVQKSANFPAEIFTI